MPLIGVDLGGTKLATALVSEDGEIKTKNIVSLNGRSGNAVGELMRQEIIQLLNTGNITGIGVAVPGIYSAISGTVWAPNIGGWEKYPLRDEIQGIANPIPVVIDSDRACYISGETWIGNAKGCTDAIFMAVGTGIGAGIISGGHIIRGAQDIAGAIGWMALHPPYKKKYDACGCYEYHASGDGIRKVFIDRLKENNRTLYGIHQLTAHDVFRLYEEGDEMARQVIVDAVRYWGMASSNLVSIFNPQKVVFGGGVFGPAQKFIDEIKSEATRWGQPISMRDVEFTTSALGGDAGVLGAAYLALKTSKAKVNAI